MNLWKTTLEPILFILPLVFSLLFPFGLCKPAISKETMDESEDVPVAESKPISSKGPIRIRHLREKRRSLGNYSPKDLALFKSVVSKETSLLQAPEFSRYQEICPTENVWEEFRASYDINNNPVEILVPDAAGLSPKIYYNRCIYAGDDNELQNCAGIPGYTSMCQQEWGWQVHLHRLKNDINAEPRFGMVAVPTRCSCKIKKIFSFH